MAPVSRSAGQSASRSCTCASEGLVADDPSGNSSVGTVWSPPLACSTNAAASGTSSMFTSVNGISALLSWVFNRRQYPHQVVLYITTLPGSGAVVLLTGVLRTQGLVDTGLVDLARAVAPLRSLCANDRCGRGIPRRAQRSTVQGAAEHGACGTAEQCLCTAQPAVSA